MKYYSEKLDKLFDTEKDLAEAELKAEQEAAAKKKAQEEAKKAADEAKIKTAKAEKEKAEKRSKDAMAITEAYKAAVKTRKEAYTEAHKTADEAYAAAAKKTEEAFKTVDDLLAQFKKDYGGYHMTITGRPDNETITFDVLNSFNDYFKSLDSFFKF